MDWEQAVAKVEKIMGKDTKIPDPPGNVAKASEEFDKAWEAFKKSRDELEDKLLTYQNSTSSHSNAVQQFADKLETSDLGCDKKAADYKKKRAEAQKIFSQFFAENKKIADINVKNAQELDKHLNNLSSYKSPKQPNM